LTIGYWLVWLEYLANVYIAEAMTTSKYSKAAETRASIC
jgi:hypothetical protein